MNNLKLKVTITGEPPRTLVSKRTGKEFSLLEVYAHTSAPYPEKISIFDDVRLPRGIYEVPFKLEVRNERLEIRFDFGAAVQAKQQQ